MNWHVEGLILAPTLLGAESVRFLGCVIFPGPTGPEWTPKEQGTLSLKPSGIAGLITARPAQAEMFTTHRIRTEVEAADSEQAFELAIPRFRRCAAGLLLSARVPVGGPINTAPECLVQPVVAQGNDGISYGAPRPYKFGALPTREPTQSNRLAAGLVEQLVGGYPVLANLLEQMYLADERAYLAFSQREEENALVDYCKILETIATDLAREHKQEQANQEAIQKEIDAIINRLRRFLEDSHPVRDNAVAVRNAQRDIAAANLESQKRQILKAGQLLMVPAEVEDTFGAVWALRSSTASHAGGGSWPSDALLNARIVTIIYLSHFIASRHVRDQGMTLAEAVAKQHQA